ncbi:MAG: Gfo/Idh/MocA family oxidoreductase [Oscillochloridaceae bacterium]|nr:Gfo/Idh/MocA family oxidoreductase [Chloroflexaceae bacterium]MDW8390712.1 Gfo/Idh/MocA family oxidoreductase [Oscillochloridaceae bacterium]
MNAVRVGVIGYGYWGPNLVRNFVELPEVELVAVADLHLSRLAKVKRRYPTTLITQDYRDLFDLGLDAAVVATPPTTHYAIARDCLQHNLHVLVEKPLTVNGAHAEELIDLAHARRRVLMVGHTFEYNAAVRELKRLIDSGELGQIYYVDAVRANLGLFQSKTNVLWDLAPHDVSIILYLLGHNIETVSAQGTACLLNGVHDNVYLHLRFAHGVTAHARLSWLDPSKTRRITVVGSRKMVVYDDVEAIEKIRIYDKGVEHMLPDDGNGDVSFNYRHGNMVIPHVPVSEPLHDQCQHFISCIMTNTEPQSNGAVGLKVVRILEQADFSLRNNGVICPVNLKAPQVQHTDLMAREVAGVVLQPFQRRAVGLE